MALNDAPNSDKATGNKIKTTAKLGIGSKIVNKLKTCLNNLLKICIKQHLVRHNMYYKDYRQKIKTKIKTCKINQK